MRDRPLADPTTKRGAPFLARPLREKWEAMQPTARKCRRGRPRPCGGGNPAGATVKGHGFNHAYAVTPHERVRSQARL